MTDDRVFDLDIDGIAWFFCVNISGRGDDLTSETRRVLYGPYSTYSAAVMKSAEYQGETPHLLTRAEYKEAKSGGIVIRAIELRGRVSDEHLK